MTALGERRALRRLHRGDPRQHHVQLIAPTSMVALLQDPRYPRRIALRVVAAHTKVSVVLWQVNTGSHNKRSSARSSTLTRTRTHTRTRTRTRSLTRTAWIHAQVQPHKHRQLEIDSHIHALERYTYTNFYCASRSSDGGAKTQQGPHHQDQQGCPTGRLRVHPHPASMSSAQKMSRASNVVRWRHQMR